MKLIDKTILFCVKAKCGLWTLSCNPSFKIIKDPWSLDSDEGARTELTFGFINNQSHQYILYSNRGVISL